MNHCQNVHVYAEGKLVDKVIMENCHGIRLKERIGMSELKSCPLCGGNMKLEKVRENQGMDGSCLNWELSCTKCGITKKYAADDFYEREYYTKEEVINDWNGLQQEPKWIPVSERLPENSGRYLAYIVNKHDDKLQYVMVCDYFADGYWNWFPDDECASDNVIAWMPLPEPYKSESVNQNG